MSKPPTVERLTATLRAPLFAGERAAYACSCGFTTVWHYERFEHFAQAEMRCHLEEAHLAEFGYGRCSECGTVTDYLRVVSAGDTGWLCESCGPTPDEAQRDMAAATNG